MVLEGPPSINSVGHINTQRLMRAIVAGQEMCAREFGEQSRAAQTCVDVVNVTLLKLGKEEGVIPGETSIKGLASGELGIFQECFAPCPKGFEKLVVKKGNPNKDQRGSCVCRLDQFHRKKFKGEKFKQREEDRKPYGSWKKPVHLRRQTRNFAPGVRTRDITALTR